MFTAYLKKLDLLVWSFNDIEFPETNNIEKLLVLLDKSEKNRFTFKEQNTFSKTIIPI